ncbi:Uncharacterised protein [Vibrio cholerae]|nr:Uncharacterised protein [Vibrio cholerae]CSC27823.1 Uncharacterised protein [Vibrio cholerae]CSC41669.1 Uncharacterised protein [Vibrio cholerae]
MALIPCLKNRSALIFRVIAMVRFYKLLKILQATFGLLALMGFFSGVKISPKLSLSS